MRDLAYDASSIRTMAEMEHIRKKSGVYGFPPATIQGCLMQIKETLDNSVDEAQDPNAIYPIYVTFFTKGCDYQVLVQDFGRGVPVEKLEVAFTKLFTSGKYEDGSYGESAGTNGMGSKVTAALSKRFVAISKRSDGFGYLEIKECVKRIHYIQSTPIDKDMSDNGTIVFLQPDPSVLKATHEFLDQGGIEKTIEHAAFVSMISQNIRIYIRRVEDTLLEDDFWESIKNNKRDTAKVWKALSNQKEGVLLFESASISPVDYVRRVYHLPEPTWQMPTLLREMNNADPDDRLGFRIDMFLDPSSLKGKGGIVASVNRTPINKKDSYHISTLYRVLKGYLISYIDEKDLLNFFQMNYDLPLSGCITVSWKRASFEGQDKHGFEDRVFEPVYAQALRKQLNKHSPEHWEQLYLALEEDLVEKYNRYTNRTMRAGKGLRGIGSILNNVNGYANCRSTDTSRTELFIVEGDSSGGRIKEGRDEDFQGVFCLRGKFLNLIKASNETRSKNALVQDMISLLNVTPASKNLDSMNFARIIICTDADSDGAHIVNLILTALWKINPLIINSGRVYVALPPLYGIKTKDRRVFLRDQSVMDDAKIDILFRELLEIDIQVGNGKPATLTGSAYTALCRAVLRIGRIVTNCSKTLNIDPMIIEQLLHVIPYIQQGHVNPEAVRRLLALDRVIYHQNTNSLILVSNDYEVPIPLDNLVTEIQNYILPEYQQLMWDRTYLYVTTTHSDYYCHTPTTPMGLFKDFEILGNLFTVNRYKGLGEMNVNDLTYTCINPATRCLTKIKELGNIKVLFDMMGVATDARKQLVTSGYVEGGINDAELDGLLD